MKCLLLGLLDHLDSSVLVVIKLIYANRAKIALAGKILVVIECEPLTLVLND